MSQDAIVKITKAEEQAEVLYRVATERAAESRADMESKAKEHLVLVESAAREKSRKQLAEASIAAKGLLQKKRAEAESEAEELSSKARERMDTAVKAIVWGIVEKCQ